MILERDQDVLKALLTTQKVVATKADNSYFGRKRTPEEKAVAVAEKKKADQEFAKKVAAELAPIVAELAEVEVKLKALGDFA